ncbi:unnamed protein product, partial [Adineta ricciae]
MTIISLFCLHLIVFIGRLQLVGSQETSNFSCSVRPSQADTTVKLQNLRTHLISNNLFAYVIFSEDEHDSEYVQLHDERRAWITGFLGSAGTAVVTRNNAALWTDGRYWTQAEDELDCKNWYLMRQGQSDVPSLSNWLASQVNGTSPYNRVGVAAQFASSRWWSEVNTALNANNASLVEVAELIDLIWSSSERPPAAANPVAHHALEYAGSTWQTKVSTIAQLVQAKKANAYVVTALDEVAWLFCLRGSDIPYNPFFKAYAMVYANETAHLWMNTSQLDAPAQADLQKVNLHPYGSFLSDLLNTASQSDVSQIWISSSASQAIYSRIPAEKRIIASSPVEVTKAIKNPVEQEGMRNCGVRDSVARVRHLAWLEDQLNQNVAINETRAAEELERFQSEESLFQMLSFDTISAFGSNGAIIHYSPKAKTAKQIDRNGLYLLD